jgi:hypothetical protein
MSTELESLIANIELPLKDGSRISEYQRSEYQRIEVHLTRFSGGVVKGTSLQFTFTNEEGEAQHFQLSNENVKLLHQQLEEHFNLK